METFIEAVQKHNIKKSDKVEFYDLDTGLHDKCRNSLLIGIGHTLPTYLGGKFTVFSLGKEYIVFEDFEGRKSRFRINSYINARNMFDYTPINVSIRKA